MKILKRPDSCVSIPVNLAGLTGFLCSLSLLMYFQPSWSLALRVSIVIFSAAFPIVLLELMFKRLPIIKQAFDRQESVIHSWKRVLIKLLALYVTFLLIALVYWVFPEYHGSFYQPFWNMLLPVIPWLVILAVPYFYLVDTYMEQPEDSYFLLGSWLLGRKKFATRPILQLMLAWLVKLFFLPLMIVYFTNNLTTLFNSHYTLHSITQSFQQTYNFLWILFFTIDIAFACIGYIFTMRLLDAHIRSTEPTATGWVSALICYQPFFGGVSALYFAYNMDQYEWGSLFVNSPDLYVFWGSLILVFLAIYSFSTVMFGIRFSNLTNRGIITNGPYRFVKHPAYISKNISWWLIAVPFVTQSNDLAIIIRSCLMLLCMNGVYYLRAKTEERHLMRDPVYQEYSNWIEKEGLVNRLKRAIFHNMK